MSLFEAGFLFACIMVLVGLARFAALAFWPDTTFAQLFARSRR